MFSEDLTAEEKSGFPVDFHEEYKRRMKEIEDQENEERPAEEQTDHNASNDNSESPTSSPSSDETSPTDKLKRFQYSVGDEIGESNSKWGKLHQFHLLKKESQSTKSSGIIPMMEQLSMIILKWTN